MNIIAIANQKGGVGKTSTTVNLAFALTRLNKTVLLVDLDPQASLTEYFIDPSTLSETTYNLLIDTHPVQTVKVSTQISLLPSNIDLASAEILLPAKLNNARTLSRMLKFYNADYALVDCPPSLGVLTTNALTAADRLIIPVATELMAERTVKLILSTIEQVRDSELNPKLKVWRILPTLFDKRLAHHKEILAALKAKYDWLLYPEPVKSSTKYKDSVTGKVDVSRLDSQQGMFWDKFALCLINECEEVRQ